MKLQVYETYEELSGHTAGLIANYIRKKPRSMVCFASGHTPIGVFKALVKEVKTGKLDLTQCTFVGLDEWGGMNGTLRGSCRQMMDEDFFHPLEMPEKQILFFDGTATNLLQQCDMMNQVIEEAGGLDIMLVGIGLNGHIGMNEPGTSFDTLAHVSELAEETRRVGQKYFSDNTGGYSNEIVLTNGLTLGLAHFRKAKLPIIMANGKKKAAIIKAMLESDPDENLPASIVHLTPQSVVMVDREASEE